jgi:hypothetical protein
MIFNDCGMCDIIDYAPVVLIKYCITQSLTPGLTPGAIEYRPYLWGYYLNKNIIKIVRHPKSQNQKP